MLRNLPIRYKLMLFSLILALVSILTIGAIALNMSEKALKAEAENKLTLLRDSRKSAIEHYFGQLMQATDMIASLPGTTRNFKDLNAIIHLMETSPAETNLTDEARSGVRTYLKGDFSRAYESSAHRSPEVDAWVNKMDPVALALQYRYIVKNPHPLGEKHQLAKAAPPEQ